MKKMLNSLVVCLAMIGIVFSGSTHAAPIKLRISHDLPPFTTPGMGISAWAKEVNKKAEGRVMVEVYPASTLADARSALEMLQSGVADGCMLSLAVHRKVFPISRVTGMQGLGFPDTVKGYQAHADTFLGLIDKYPVLADELKDIKIIFDIVNSNSLLLSSDKEIHLPSDLKGLKVGATGPSGELVKRMGGASVFSVPPQAYQKLQTGVLDAQPIHFLAIGEFKLYEVAKYVLDLSWGQGELPLVLSKNSWNKLSAADQKIIMEAGVIGQQVAFQAAEKRSISGRQAFLDAGGTIVTPTAEEKAAWMKEFSILWEEYIAEINADGIKEARSIFNDWKKASEQSWQ